MIKTEITPGLIFKLYKNCDSFRSLIYELNINYTIGFFEKDYLEFEIRNHTFFKELAGYYTSGDFNVCLIVTSNGDSYIQFTYYVEIVGRDYGKSKSKRIPLSAEKWITMMKRASLEEDIFYHNCHKDSHEGDSKRFWAEIEKFEPFYGKTNTQKMIECVV